MSEKAADCVAFWVDAGWEKWFTKSDDFDAEFRRRFLDLHFEAARREHDGWIETPEGALALMILLDQFPRNAFRGTAHMFATDPLARMYAHQAIARGHDKVFDAMLPAFFYLPFEHAEDLAMQDESVRLFTALAAEAPELADMLDYAHRHHVVIARFGRFAHRNAILGRASTLDELAFLQEPGSSF